MNDVFDAIERLSAELSLRVARLSSDRGWATKPYSAMVVRGERFKILVTTTVAFPFGFYASFAPRAEADGDSWSIDIRRTDGVSRSEWAVGLRVARVGKGYALVRQNDVLGDELLAQVLEALAES
jgi:hypothetical protein